MAFSNMNSDNMPQSTPSPYHDKYKDRPMNIPWYQEYDDPFYDTVNGENVYTKWVFYLGLMINSSRVHGLIFDWIIVILMNYYFIHFYSLVFDISLNIDVKDRVNHILQNRGNEQLGDNASSRDSIDARSNDFGNLSLITNEGEEEFSEHELFSQKSVTDLVHKLKNKLLIRKTFNILSIALCSLSSITTLVLLLLISLQNEGFITLFYIFF
jgi:hypothetical protein